MRNALTAAVAVLCLTTTSHAQCPGGACPRPAGWVVRYQPAAPVVYQAPAAWYTPAPQAAPAYQAPAQWTAGDEAGAFLAALNEWRRWHGRPPLAWDAALAAYAATNGGTHAPGSSGGGSQCWAGTGSLMAALRMWQASPSHAAILLSGTTVGASPCPSGATANVR